jgi:hypothetical protein
MTTPPSKTTPKMALSLLCLSWLVHAQTGKTLWVLQEPNGIVAYDPNTLVVRSSHQVPSEVFQSPQDLQINGKGQMLFLPATVREPDGLVHESSNPKVWFWDGSSAKFLNRTITSTHVPSGGNVLVSSAKPRCFLSASGAHLFWFENRLKTLQTPDMGQDISVNTTFHAWQTDLSGEHPEEIATYIFAPCKCETAVCSETCPEASYWLPDNGIEDHFITTHWVPGQLQPEYQASFLYRKSASGWHETKLPSALEQVLDSSSDSSGLALIEAIPDGGCCGWVNGSDDQTLLTRNGKSVVLFDELQQYRNQDYDVSFFTTNAKLSPRSLLAAVTVAATNEPGGEIRLSDGGKANAAELSRIQQALRDLPAVEVYRLDDPPQRTVTIPHARLVGWINEQEILLIENGFLVSYNVISGKRRNSEIKAAKESYAFLR